MDVIQKYIGEMKEIQDLLLDFLDNEQESEESYAKIIKIIDHQQLQNDIYKLKAILYLILEIANNHHRKSDFYSKIEKIMIIFKNYIEHSFSNLQIFNFYRKNKIILLILLKQNVLKIDDSIINLMEINKYTAYFLPEINKEIPDSIFDSKRKIGENDNYICEIIRKDDIDNFVIFHHKKNLNLTQELPYSIFETNPIFLKKMPTLIEYSAFFGSIQIFKYLTFNGVELTESLWDYSIYSKNADFIHILEDNHVGERKIIKSLNKRLQIAVKCHNNEIAAYFRDNFVDTNNEIYSIKYKHSKNLTDYCFHYYNFAMMPSELDLKFVFFYLCHYDHFKIVKLLVEKPEINIRDDVIGDKVFIILF